MSFQHTDVSYFVLMFHTSLVV